MCALTGRLRTADSSCRADQDHFALPSLHHGRQKCLDGAQCAKIIELHRLLKDMKVLLQESAYALTLHVARGQIANAKASYCLLAHEVRVARD